jgi:hypothetical protein
VQQKERKQLFLFNYFTPGISVQDKNKSLKNI